MDCVPKSADDASTMCEGRVERTSSSVVRIVLISPASSSPVPSFCLVTVASALVPHALKSSSIDISLALCLCNIAVSMPRGRSLR